MNSDRHDDPPVIVRKTPVYRLGSGFLNLVLYLMCRRRVEGLEHLPLEGGCVIASNHQSYLDIPLISGATSRHVSFVGRSTLSRSRMIGFLMVQSGAVFVRRDQPAHSAVRAMVQHLELGDCVALFPEGTRSADGRLGRFRSGAIMAARKAGVPVVPVGVRGCIDAMPRTAKFPRPRKVAIRFGPPIDSALPDALEQLRVAVTALSGADADPPARYRSLSEI